ncbi:hypothetical protein KPH14_004300 [Odynerus spinipes]|uniref:Uncharacterized protein n=1 Tax=Odynerus spinipes TaxID=1348599 RepID=A0AAD9RYH2_9HYME|nr:hypothetical protein KPH14_004300 [Odynerus spinipes]
MDWTSPRARDVLRNWVNGITVERSSFEILNKILGERVTWISRLLPVDPGASKPAAWYPVRQGISQQIRRLNLGVI